VFGNRTPRRIFESKREEVTRKWGRLYNKGHNDLYSDNQIKKNETGVRPEGWRQIGRRRRWKDNIKIDVHDMKWGHGMD